MDDEEDLSCCPPALETVENSVAVDREAGGSEGPQDQYEEEDEDPGHQPSFDAAVVRELALAIRVSSPKLRATTFLQCFLVVRIPEL